MGALCLFYVQYNTKNCLKMETKTVVIKQCYISEFLFSVKLHYPQVQACSYKLLKW